MKRKSLAMYISLGLIGTLVASPSLSTTAFAAISYNSTSIDANLNSTSTPDHVVLEWTGDPTTTQTITWRTISTDKKSNVQYRVKGTSNWTTSTDLTPKTLTSYTGDSTVATGKESIYSINLTGLTPGTTYEYQIVATDASDAVQTSNISTFKTETTNNINTKFIVFGDSQSGDPTNPEYTPWNNTITKAYEQNPDANFVINMGDLVEIGQNYQHWNNWFSAANSVINNIPEMPVQGNHETYQNNSFVSSSPQDFVNQFSVPKNGPSGHIGQTYSYNYGNIHFVVLDSQEDEEAPANDSFLQEQADWLDKDLQENTQKWTIVMFHKTPYYNKATRNNPAVKSILTPVIEKHHVDIVFNGHDHGISRTYAINGDNYYTDYSKGTVYYVTGRSGNKYYTDLNTKAWDANFIDCQDSPSYEVVAVKDGKLTIDAYKYNIIDTSSTNAKNALYNTPVKVDSFTIDKDNPSNSTKLTLNSSKDTQLAIAGTVQSGYSATVSNGKGYIDPTLIAKYYKGTYDTSSLTLTVNKKAYTFTANDLLNNDSTKVSIDALYKQGIEVIYNEQLNCIFVDFTGRITSDIISNFKGINIGTNSTPVTTSAAVTCVHKLDDITVSKGTNISDLNLPDKVSVDLSNSSTTSAAVVWDHGNPEYNGNTEGIYTFTGSLKLSDGVTNENELSAKVNVIVGQTNTKSISAKIDGTTRVGDTLTAQLIDANGNKFTTSSAVTFDWYRLNDSNSEFSNKIGTGNTYQLITDDLDKYIGVRAIYDGKDYHYTVGRILEKLSSSGSSSSHHSSHHSSSSSQDSSTSTSTANASTSDATTKNNNNNNNSNNSTSNNDNSNKKGWSQGTDGKWYLVNETGEKVKGWKLVDNSWYLFNNNGAMVTGWYKPEGGNAYENQWFHLGANGKMDTGWVKDADGKWYYLDNTTGAMKTGWIQDGGKWYYLYSNGSLATSTTIDGYMVNENGEWA